MFLNRESLDQVSNSKAPFVFVLDFSMAEHQQPENTANVNETEVPPRPEAVSFCLFDILTLCHWCILPYDRMRALVRGISNPMTALRRSSSAPSMT